MILDLIWEQIFLFLLLKTLLKYQVSKYWVVTRDNVNENNISIIFQGTQNTLYFAWGQGSAYFRYMSTSLFEP